MKKIHLNIKKNAFTLIELLFVCMILALIMPAMFSIYNFMINSNREVSAREDVIQQSYEFLEKLNILMQDYTIDYEEYFNRQMVGCTTNENIGSNFTWNVGRSGYCTAFTAYGNKNSTENKIKQGTKIEEIYHDLYYCSSSVLNDENQPAPVPRIVNKDKCGTLLQGQQSYGQYEALFTDVHNDTDNNLNYVGDSDDENLGYAMNNVIAIRDPNNVKELYLISNDGKSRLYFRRKLIQEKDGFAQYKIQMLRLKGFDAGYMHDFNSTGLYDGKIDTWACDSGMGFIGHGKSISGAYAGYFLPKDAEDCRVDLTQGAMSVMVRNMKISPINSPDLSWNKQEYQINPFINILTVNGIYKPYYAAKVSDSIADFKMPIETTFNIKSFYTDF